MMALVLNLDAITGSSIEGVARDMVNAANRIANPVQRTNSYGEPAGEAISFQQMIGEAVDAALTQKFDPYGKPTRTTNGSQLW